jgi:Pretoxin HINT domain
MAKKRRDDDGGGPWNERYGKALFVTGAVTLGVAAVAAFGLGIVPPGVGYSLAGAGLGNMITGGVMYGTSPAPGCFVAGTIVSTINGLAPIERIRTGDHIRTIDLKERKLGSSRVVKTFKFPKIQVLELGFDDETIACTPQHRFYRRGWVAAMNLKPGDTLYGGDGKEAELKSVRRKLKLQFVYNLGVEGRHNYLVGKSKLLVHNRKESTGESAEEKSDDDDNK